jgi:glycosyltransferase involved in cell wall biosynthesis
VICGIVQDERYFAAAVEPHIDGDQVVYLGSVGPARRAEILGGAMALLHPISFDEPFGLSVVEAMVCGTPVVTYRRGSMAEVVDEGVTGYLAHDVGSAISAVPRAARLDRSAVHARAAGRFGADRMVEDYLRTYEALLSSASTSASGA